VPLVRIVGHLVDRHRDRQDEAVILAGLDVDALP
jgi:hypothetical protein